ncbi:hypothetical protein D9V86_12085 [Bacteroidetes/Chlorobi group bacterium ChocPot_Mid]|nr:MAG: hypothetical protein D9V86_12085 [Bacteroidetes/Chlorobi group bacterium ChocPot_Mid]
MFDKVKLYVKQYALSIGISELVVNAQFAKLVNVYTDAGVFITESSYNLLSDIALKSSDILLAAYNRGYVDSINYYMLYDVAYAASNSNFLLADSIISSIDINSLDTNIYRPTLTAIAIYNASLKFTQNLVESPSCGSINPIIIKKCKCKKPKIQTNWNAEYGIATGIADWLGGFVTWEGGGIGAIPASGTVGIIWGVTAGWFAPDTGCCTCGSSCNCNK